MSVKLPLDEMTLHEKLEAMEILWEDLVRNPENVEFPEWHREILADRERRIAEDREADGGQNYGGGGGS